MRRITAHLFSSVDGVVESPGEWQHGAFGEEEGQMMGEVLSTVDEVILGRVMYEEWAGYWPNNPGDGFDEFINPVTKRVATRTLTDPLEWENSHVIEGDLLDFVRELRAGDGGDVSVNGITVIAELLEAGLLDELRLTVHPILVGKGRRLSDHLGGPLRLELVEGTTTRAGNLMLTYRRRADETIVVG